MNDNLDRLLRSRQRKSMNYECHSVPRDKFRSLSLPPNGDKLSYVTMLHVDIRFKHDCKRAATILKDAPRVTSLAITFSQSEPGYGFMGNHNQTQIGRTIVDLLFGAAHAQRGQLNLTALRFDGMCLADSGEPLSGYVALQSLQHLQLLRCGNVHPFLEALTQRCSGLESFALEHCHGGTQISTVDNFLGPTTPKQLVLKTLLSDRNHFNGSDTVRYDTLSHYAHAIRCLVLDDSLPRHHVSSLERIAGSSTSFLDLCKSLQSLQQLCIVPATISPRSGAWGIFLELLVRIRLHLGSNTNTYNKGRII